MILNLLRVEALRVEEMIKRSFSENASQRLLPDHQKKVLEVSLLLVVGIHCTLPLKRNIRARKSSVYFRRWTTL